MECEIQNFQDITQSTLRKANGELYPAGTLRAIRSGLHRYIKLPPNPRSDINICDKEQFTASNNMLKTKAKSYTKQDYAVRPEKKGSNHRRGFCSHR